MFINGTYFNSKLTSGAFKSRIITSVIGVCLAFLCTFNALAQDSLLAGNPKGMDLFSKAKTYHDGDGVAVDLKKAHDLYKQSAAMGNIDARINLGYMYFVGEGVTRNYNTAREYYLVAANAGDDVAQKNLGAIYEHGLGVKRDMRKARRWYDKSEGKLPPAKPARKITVAKPPAPKKVARTVAKTPAAELRHTPALTPTPIKIQAEVKTNPAIRAGTEMGPSPRPDTVESIKVNGTTVPTTSNITTLFVPETPLSASMVDTASIAPTIVSARAPKPLLRRSSKWTSYIIGIVLLSIALVSSLWYALQVRTITRSNHQYNFASNFFAAHRESLRGSYLRTPENQRMFLYPNDPWAVSVCALMVRFAVQRHEDPHTKCKTSAQIVHALEDTPYEARLETFALVGVVQERLFADIQHLNKDTIHPPKPFQFKYTRFLSKTKGKKLGNTRPAPLRLVN